MPRLPAHGAVQRRDPKKLAEIKIDAKTFDLLIVGKFSTFWIGFIICGMNILMAGEHFPSTHNFNQNPHFHFFLKSYNDSSVDSTVRWDKQSWSWCYSSSSSSLSFWSFVQGVPQLSSHFVLHFFSAYRTHTEVHFTIFQQPGRRRFQNSPYFPPYVKNWSSYRANREANWI